MLSGRQKGLLNQYSSLQEIPFEVWQQLNENNKSDNLEEEIIGYLGRKEDVTETASDVRYMPKASRTKKSN